MYPNTAGKEHQGTGTCWWMSAEGRGPGARARAEPHVVLCLLEQRVPAVLHGKATGALGLGNPCIGLCRMASPVFLSPVG